LSEKERGIFERLMGLFQGEQEVPPTEEELFEIINASGETGVITDDTHEMLSSVIQLKETQVQEVMVPRTEFSAIAADSRIKTAISIINDKGFSRYPIFHDNLDQVIGILHAKDILKHLDKNLEHLNLLVHHGLGFGAFKGDLYVVVCRGLFCAGFHRLPELVLEAFGDHGDVGLFRGCGGFFTAGGLLGSGFFSAAAASDEQRGDHQNADEGEKDVLGFHFSLLVFLGFRLKVGR
jgi:hypothetical protein